jgi:hypothetical protein
MSPMYIRTVPPPKSYLILRTAVSVLSPGQEKNYHILYNLNYNDLQNVLQNPIKLYTSIFFLLLFLKYINDDIVIYSEE